MPTDTLEQLALRRALHRLGDAQKELVKANLFHGSAPIPEGWHDDLIRHLIDLRRRVIQRFEEVGGQWQDRKREEP